MTIRQMERILTREMKKKFDQSVPRKFDKIYIFKRPFQSSKLKKKWNEIYARKRICKSGSRKHVRYISSQPYR